MLALAGRSAQQAQRAADHHVGASEQGDGDGGRRQLPQRRDRSGTRGRARRGRRPAPRDRPHLPGERIWADDMWFYVAGILNPAVLAPDIDSSVLVGFPAAQHYLGFDGHPSTI